MDSRKPGRLGEFVKKIRSIKNLSVDAVSEKSGGKISSSYVNKIENENVNVTTPKLKALAKGLGVTESEIFAVARGVDVDEKAIANERFSQIAEGYALLSAQERENIEPLLTAIEIAIERSEKRNRTSKGHIPTITLEEAKADDEIKTGKK
ncbi:MAG TPA: helix-turn-helix transcriptional regulator [Pyrinomonadaceae bacterium]